MKLSIEFSLLTLTLFLSLNAHAEIPNFLIGKWQPDLEKSIRYMKDNASLWHDEQEAEYTQRLNEWIKAKEVEFTQLAFVLRVSGNDDFEKNRITKTSQEGVIYILTAENEEEACIILVSRYLDNTIHLKISSGSDLDYMIWKKK